MKVFGKVLVFGSMENSMRILPLDNIGFVKVIEERRLVIYNRSNGIAVDLIYPTAKDALGDYVLIINALSGLPSHQEIFLDYDGSNTKSVSYLCLKQKLKMKTD